MWSLAYWLGCCVRGNISCLLHCTDPSGPDKHIKNDCGDVGHRGCSVICDIFKENTTLPVSWRIHFCPALSRFISKVFNSLIYKLLLSDDFNRRWKSPTCRLSNANHMMRVFFFFLQKCSHQWHCSLLKLPLISFKARWKSHWYFPLCILGISSWRQVTWLTFSGSEDLLTDW